MTEHNVLVLALGATRRRAALDDAARVAAAGGAPVVLVDDSAAWRNDKPAPGVRIVDRAELERRHTWLRWEHLLLYRLPGAALRRTAGERFGRAYRRRVADRLHRRVFLPLARRRATELPAGLIRRHIDATGKLDLLVVNDPASMPVAVSLLRTYGTDAPRVAYGIDEAVADRQA